MSNWSKVEVYATFIRLSGEIEIVRPDRLSDAVNRFGQFIELRNAKAEPMSVNYPVLSRKEEKMTIAKASVILIAPEDGNEESNSPMWRAKVSQPVAINTQAFSLLGDVHLEPRHSLQDHLERFPGDFIPVTNLSALWVTAISDETHSIQRPFALINPASILSFAPR